MKNEPVAWMVERTTGTKGYGDTPYVTLLDATKSTYWIKNEIPEGYTVIPLYTAEQLHPVKEQDESFDRTASHMAGEYVSYPVKSLTDEEIRHIQAICHLKDVGYDNFIMRFARAILRKAQDK